jgi:hypothetical protein
MARRSLNFIADTATGRLLQSTSATTSAAVPALVFGDTVPVTVLLVEPNPGGGIDNPWRNVDLDGRTIRIAIGTPGGEPAAYAEIVGEPIAPDIDIADLGSSGFESQSITLTGDIDGGTYRLEYDGDYSDEIAHDATPATLQVALRALTSLAVSVSGAFPAYVVKFPADVVDPELFTADPSGLRPPAWRSGDLSLNTDEMDDLLDSKASVQTQFEIELWDDTESEAWTVFQGPVTVRNEVIPGDPTTPTSGPIYPTLEGLVALRLVNLSIYNNSGDDVTFNDVLCPYEELTPVGEVDPLNVTYVAASSASIVGQSDGEVDCGFTSGTSISTGGVLALPIVTRPGSTVTLSLVGA